MDCEWRERLWYTTQLAVVYTLAVVAMNEPLEFSKLTRVRGAAGNAETAAVMVATVDNGKEMVRRDAGGSDA